MSKGKERLEKLAIERKFNPRKMKQLAELAQKELLYSDYISMRCHKNNFTYSQEWKDRDDVLRNIVNGDRNTLQSNDFKIPNRPNKPWVEISAVGTAIGSSNTSFDSA